MASKNLKKSARAPKTAASPLSPVPVVSAAPAPETAAPRRRAKAAPAATANAPASPATRKPAVRRTARAKAPAAASPTEPATALPAPTPRTVSDEDVRLRAYFLSVEHHGQGSPDYFWLLAERELRGRARGATE